ncbi:MAG: triose-phosphate isomerase [Planctomycetes bacterium]|nr:triose-phosphate isomerase [Planctomycetota bacterium]
MASRRPFVGGNWKMNTDLASAVELADEIAASCGQFVEHCDIAVYPPFPYLQAVGRTLGHHGVQLGAQDLYPQPDGPYTGEVSTDMLLDLNVQVVLAGHSERRHVIGEDDELVNAKVRRALEAGLNVVVCIGETHEQRQAGQTDQVNINQLMSGLREVGIDQLRQVTIAYEPVWAIGTGKVAGPGDAEAVHRLVRRNIADLYDEDAARSIRIQYGGSVNAENAADLFARGEIDGALVGGASLDAEQFMAIVRAAVEAKEVNREARSR